MRTNIVIDDELMLQAQQLTGIETKRQVVDKALRFLVEMYQQGEVRGLRGQLHWEGDLEEMREDRFELVG